MTSRTSRGLARLIVAYQHARRSPSPCRYYPSCSEYALGAVETHGAGRGTWLALRRLSRCHPLGGHGYDPVPDPAGGAADGPTPREITCNR